jgi:hypothetical protein
MGDVSVEIQAYRRFRFAWSSILQKHADSKQAESNETGSEPDLPAKDGEAPQSHGAHHYQRDNHVPAHRNSVYEARLIRTKPLRSLR